VSGWIFARLFCTWTFQNTYAYLSSLTLEKWAALGSALSGVAVLVSGISILLLYFQNRSARRQADSANETLRILQNDRADAEIRNAYYAQDMFSAIRARLVWLCDDFNKGRFGEHQHAALVPSNWTDCAFALWKKHPEAGDPSVARGLLCVISIWLCRSTSGVVMRSKRFHQKRRCERSFATQSPSFVSLLLSGTVHRRSSCD